VSIKKPKHKNNFNMQRLHSFLEKKLRWYSKWHAYEHHQAYHFVALLILAGFIGSVIILSEFGHKPQPLDSSAATTTDVVLYASDATSVTGAWSKVNDLAAAGGVRLYNPNANATKVNPAQTSPTNYFEATFSAEAGTPYHVWLRSKADDDNWANDSVLVQFSDSVDAKGSSVYRLGTVNAMTVQLEEGRDAGVQGWGWNDNDWGALGAHVYFAQSGTHTVRIQQREDGISIDQIVLSPSRYLTTSPGALKNDMTIVSKPAPVVPPTPTSTLPSQDIGSTAIPGSLTSANGSYTITASGTDIWAGADGFRYSYQPMTGDGTVVARIVSAQQVDDFTLAGVMIRESLTADSRQASMLVTPNGRAKFRYRTITGGSTVSEGPGAGTITLPRLVKVTRQGNNFSGSISSDGITWQSIGSTTTIGMGANVYAGIAVTSHTNAALTTAVVDQYGVTAAVIPPADTTPPTVSLTAPAAGATISGTTVAVSASASDNSGTVSKVEFLKDGSVFATDTTPPFSASLDSTTLINGLHSLSAKAYDPNNNLGTSSSVSVTVSNPITVPPITCPTTIPSGAFLGCYYDNIDFSGAVVVKNPDAYPLNFDWASGSPTSSMGADQFSVRWVGNFSFEASDYTFTTTSDDGVRVYVDNQLIIDKWFGQAPTTYTAVKTLTAGNHQVKMDYFEDAGGATARLSWAKNAVTQPPITTGQTLSIVEYNLAQGTGTDGVYNPDRQITEILKTNPNIGGFVEANNSADYEVRIRNITGQTWYSYWESDKGSGVDEGLQILSKFPLSNGSVIHFTCSRSTYSPCSYGAIHAEANVGGRPLHIFVTHLYICWTGGCPDPNERAVQDDQMSQLRAWANTFSGSKIILGDFNQWTDGSVCTLTAMSSTYEDAWTKSMSLGTASAYSDNPVDCQTRTRRGRIDYIFKPATDSKLVVKSASIPDTRDLSRSASLTNGTLDDKGVRPSDHNKVTAIIDFLP
jgi:endonuclease/exonuclease/phosphatase family metal-dependent hydrolase